MVLDLLQGFYSTADVVIVGIIMVLALVFHNVVQAYVASRLGDSTAKFQGYMKFDPQQHLEPMGVLFLFILGFGWPKFIPVNGRNYAGRGRREAWVWYSGPLAYLVVAFLCVVFAGISSAVGSLQLEGSFYKASVAAILHAVINFFPVYPLDGAKAALAWGNQAVRNFIQQIAQFGFIGFIVIFMLLSFTGVIRFLQIFFLVVFQNIIRIFGL